MNEREASKVAIYELKTEQKIHDATIVTNGLEYRLRGNYEAGNVEVTVAGFNSYAELITPGSTLQVTIYSGGEHLHSAPVFQPISRLHEIFHQLRNGSIRRALKILYGYNVDGTVRDREELKVLIAVAAERNTRQFDKYDVTDTPLFRLAFMKILQLDEHAITRVIDASDWKGALDNNTVGLRDCLLEIRKKTLDEIDQ